jgi:two-component system nitrate/nitrite response regulator NarL
MSFEPFDVARDLVWAQVLSPRELDVALLVARGHSNKQVARALGVTEGTVKLHMHSILRKLRAESRYTLILQAQSNVQQSA